ncbi:unnamed protein product [Cunninghamella blakesleeana]
MTDTDIIVEPQGEELYCKWKDCLKPFTSNQALNQHLCDDHIGWKKDKYCCEWTGCSKQGVKCHNRFALIVHIRTHTGEKLYECDIDGCGLSFGRVDILERHKKTDHGIDTQQQQDNHIKNETVVIQNNNNSNTSPEFTIGGLQENRKRKLAREEDYNDKHKREKNEEIAIHEPATSDIEESEDMDTYDTSDRTHYHPSSSSHHQHQQKPIPSSLSSNNHLSQNKYKVAKAKLQYILRENEMLNDEWSSLQRKLKRLQTERRVLLDVLMSAEDHHDDDMYSLEGGDEEEDNQHYHPNDTTTTSSTTTNLKHQEQQQPLDNQPTMVDVL